MSSTENEHPHQQTQAIYIRDNNLFTAKTKLSTTTITNTSSLQHYNSDKL